MQQKFNFDLDQSENLQEEFLTGKNNFQPPLEDSQFEKAYQRESLMEAYYNQVTSPIPGFVVIVNSHGEIVDHLSNDYSSPEVLELVSYLNINFSEHSPHSAWSCNGSFERVML